MRSPGRAIRSPRKMRVRSLLLLRLGEQGEGCCHQLTVSRGVLGEALE